MPDSRITSLNELPEDNKYYAWAERAPMPPGGDDRVPDSQDLLIFVDISDSQMSVRGTNKKITFKNLTNHMHGIEHIFPEDKTGIDSQLVTGTAGQNRRIAIWDPNGDAIEASGNVVINPDGTTSIGLDDNALAKFTVYGTDSQDEVVTIVSSPNQQADIFQILDSQQAELFTVTKDGYLGVIQGTPTEPIHVGNDTDSQTYVRIQNPSGNIYIGQDENTKFGIASGSANIFKSTDDVPFVIGTEDSQVFIIGTTNSERVRVDEQGRVGIGISDLTGSKVTIVNGNAAEVGLLVKAISGQTEDIFQVRDASENQLFEIEDDGHVNIRKISGTLRLRLVGSNGSFITFSNSYGNDGSYIGWSSDADETYYYSQNNDRHRFYDNAGTQLTLNTGGKAVINGTDSLGTLTVYGHSKDDETLIVKAADSQAENIVEVQNYSGTELFTVTSEGQLLTTQNPDGDSQTGYDDPTIATYGRPNAGFYFRNGTPGVVYDNEDETTRKAIFDSQGWKIDAMGAFQFSADSQDPLVPADVKLHRQAPGILSLNSLTRSDNAQLIVGGDDSQSSTLTVYQHDTAGHGILIQGASAQHDGAPIDDSQNAPLANAALFSIRDVTEHPSHSFGYRYYYNTHKTNVAANGPIIGLRRSRHGTAPVTNTDNLGSLIWYGDTAVGYVDAGKIRVDVTESDSQYVPTQMIFSISSNKEDQRDTTENESGKTGSIKDVVWFHSDETVSIQDAESLGTLTVHGSKRNEPVLVLKSLGDVDQDDTLDTQGDSDAPSNQMSDIVQIRDVQDTNLIRVDKNGHLAIHSQPDYLWAQAATDPINDPWAENEGEPGTTNRNGSDYGIGYLYHAGSYTVLEDSPLSSWNSGRHFQFRVSRSIGYSDANVNMQREAIYSNYAISILEINDESGTLIQTTDADLIDASLTNYGDETNNISTDTRDLKIRTGNILNGSGARNTGAIWIQSGQIDSSVATGGTGQVSIQSGGSYSGTNSTGAVVISSGTTEGVTGYLDLRTGYSSGDSNTGYVYIGTGMVLGSSSGDSGSITLQTGDSTAGRSGDIIFGIGTGGSSNGIVRPSTGDTYDLGSTSYAWNGFYTNTICFNGTSQTAAARTLSWNADDETLNLGLDGDVTLQIGQETLMRVKAKDIIRNGMAVYASGQVGGSDNIEVSRFNATSDSQLFIEELYFIGLATEDLDSQETGFVTTFGKVRGVNASTYSSGGIRDDADSQWVVGDILYAGTNTAGTLTKYEPISPDRIMPIAMVLKVPNETNVTLFARAEHGYHLNEIHDVYTSNVQNGETLAWNSSTRRWENSTSSGSGTVTSVDMTVPTGFAISGNPITSSGTLALAFDTGYSLPTSSSQTNWDTAYGWGDHSTAGYLTDITGENLSSLADVTITSIASGEVLKWSGSAWINNTLAEAGIAATGHTHATSDITSGTFADARIAQSNVTQHQAALSITESQISDFGTYLTGITGESIGSLSDVTITTIASGEILKWSGTAWINNTLAEAGIAATGHTHATSDITSGTFADARVAESNVTQHQAALSITESQISDLGSYITASSTDNLTNKTFSDHITVAEIAAPSTPSTGFGAIYAKTDGKLYFKNDSGTETDLTAGAGAGSGTVTSVDMTVPTGFAISGNPITTSGTLALAFDTGYSLPTTTKQTNWDTAYGWGDHSVAGYLTDITGENLSTLADVTITTIASGEILKWSGTAWINNTLAEAGIAAASHTHATSDITSGTFADARIAQSNVTQHQAALSITESQISDLGSYISNVVEDTTPQLGGQLDVNGQAIGDGTRELLTFTEDASAVNHVNIENEATGSGPIISAAGDDTNIDLNLSAKGTGNISLGNITFDADQTIGAGQDNYVLTYDHSAGTISLEAASGGGGGISNVVEDTTPQLGGNLDVNGNSIVSVTNGNITLAPDGTGVVQVNDQLVVGSSSTALGTTTIYGHNASSKTFVAKAASGQVVAAIRAEKFDNSPIFEAYGNGYVGINTTGGAGNTADELLYVRNGNIRLTALYKLRWVNTSESYFSAKANTGDAYVDCFADGTQAFRAHHTGAFTINGASSLATTTIYGHSPSDEALVIQAASNQASANILTIQSSAATKYFEVADSGKVKINSAPVVAWLSTHTTTGTAFAATAADQNYFVAQFGNSTYGNSNCHDLLILNNGTLTWYMPDDGSTPADIQFHSRDTGGYPLTIKSDENQIIVNGTNPLATATIYGHSASDEALVVKAAASPSADIFTVISSASSPYLTVNSSGQFRVGSLTPSGGWQHAITSTNEAVFEVRSNAAYGARISLANSSNAWFLYSPSTSGWYSGYTAGDLIISDNVGATPQLLLSKAANQVTVNGAAPSGTFTVYGHSASVETLVVEAAASQTADIVNIQSNGGGSTYLSVDNNGYVGVNTGSPNSNLHVSGSLSLPITSVASTDTLDATDHTVLVNATTGDVTLNLPAASGVNGRMYIIKKTDSSSNNVIIDPNSTETIDGSSTFSFNSQYRSVTIQCDGSNWYIISSYIVNY